MLNNYCKANCWYCPSSFWGGEEPRNIELYLNFAQRANEFFDKINRSIDWTFNGGEPLDMFDLPQLLKLCKRENNLIELTTNGGRLWLDWWAIEPHVDVLNLTYHYWQNPNLVKYIVELYLEKNKTINLTIPIRPNEFSEDYDKATELQSIYKIPIIKILLIENMDWMKGYYSYTPEQIELINGPGSSTQTKMLVNETLQEQHERLLKNSPSYTGKRCNVGIEKINISAQGFASGSNCTNSPMGNIWEEDFKFFTEPQVCKMMACMDPQDQKIMKFD